jgi:flagella basal body P-ring formation protein FlgA
MRCSRKSTTCLASALVALAATSALALGAATPAAGDQTAALAALVEQAAADRMPGLRPRARIERVTLPAGAAPDRARPSSDARLSHRSTFLLYAGARVIGSAQAIVDGDVPHARASRAIARGETIAATDMREADASPGLVMLRGLPRMAAIEGGVAARDIAAGAPIERADVRFAVLVRSGSSVTLRVSVGAVRAATEATALQSGAAGDVVMVMNRETRKRIRARVVGPSEVEVVDEQY